MPRRKSARPPFELAGIHASNDSPPDTGAVFAAAVADARAKQIDAEVRPIPPPDEIVALAPSDRPLYVFGEVTREGEWPKPEAPLIPADWSHGALLNVRNGGDAYIVTLFPEEYDYRHPERAMRFPNPALCQNFVSAWYARQHHDPRA